MERTEGKAHAGRRVLRWLGKALLLLLAVLALLLLLCYVNHCIRLKQEETLCAPIGTQVEVNGHTMNVYAEGTGGPTLVFLSGGGTCSPVLDFKSLYSLLSGEYRIAVVEKAGYGFSDVTMDALRDIDTILEESRQAIQMAGVEGPYVLCPHSMSGLEAVYWAQKYPGEVAAIVGLDMAVPEIYEDYPVSIPLQRIAAFAASIGLTRWLPGLESDAVRYGTLTEEEKALYRALFYRRTATADMLREAEMLKENARTVAGGGRPGVPMLLFVSDGAGTGWEEEKWRSYPRRFLEGGSGRLVELDCGHYVHDFEYRRIAQEMGAFLKALG